MIRMLKPSRKGALLIADDHEVFRLGLGQVLADKLGARRVIEVSDFEEALENLADQEIFLALFDLDMPGLASAHDLWRVRRLRPDVHTVVISGSQAREDILAALEAGVHGYIVKSARTQEIVQHLERVLAGDIYVPPILAELPCAASFEVADEAKPIPALTDRQSDVLRLIAMGQSNKEIGRALGITEGTVKMHVSVILRAVNASNRAQAAAIARQYFGQDPQPYPHTTRQQARSV